MISKEQVLPPPQAALAINYPVTLAFKIITIAPQIKVTDASGQTVLYVRQKALAMREDVRIFADEEQQHQLFQLNADRIIGWSANYHVRSASGEDLGNVRRKGARSIWRATYVVTDAAGADFVVIHEENPWIKVLDRIIGELPVIGMIFSTFIAPAYVADRAGQVLLRMKKEPALLEKKFSIEKKGEFGDHENSLLLASLLMMILLERQRG